MDSTTESFQFTAQVVGFIYGLGFRFRDIRHAETPMKPLQKNRKGPETPHKIPESPNMGSILLLDQTPNPETPLFLS